MKRLVSLCAGVQGSLNILGNVAAGDFRNCVPPVPLRHFYAISAWGCIEKYELIIWSVLRKTALYQALAVFVEKYEDMESGV